MSYQGRITYHLSQICYNHYCRTQYYSRADLFRQMHDPSSSPLPLLPAFTVGYWKWVGSIDYQAYWQGGERTYPGRVVYQRCRETIRLDKVLAHPLSPVIKCTNITRPSALS